MTGLFNRTDRQPRPAWERWLAIALVVAVVLGIAVAVWVYRAAGG